MSDCVNQNHRELAASKIKGDDAKSRKARESILNGKSDDHPSVQAAVFYGERT